MEIRYCCPFWGCEHLEAAAFIEQCLAAGYQGIEINWPSAHEAFTSTFLKQLEAIRHTDPHFLFIPQQLTSPHGMPVDALIEKMKQKLSELAALSPDFINSHTGKDYYTFDDNCRILEAALTFGQQRGVRILHETHRGRFSFHAASLIPYLERFPELELVGDFSHFCTVSESLLQDQTAIIDRIIPHISHLHARIGHEQGPQVNHPQAPEWAKHWDYFFQWWKAIVANKRQSGAEYFSITPEFGPAPYMPAEPFTQKPLSSQWDNNVFMRDQLMELLQGGGR